MQYWFNLSIAICFLVATCSCNNSSRTDRRLFVADSLANEDKIDSTISILKNIEYSELNEWNKHYFDLLVIKYRDKAFIPHKTDSLLIDIIHFFEKNGGTTELTAAYFYGGRVWNDLSNTPMALDFFRKAYNRLDDSPSELKGEITAQMGQIHLELFQFTEAKPKFREAISHNAAIQDTLALIYNYRQLGETYQMLGENDSALLNFYTALDLAKSIDTSRVHEAEMHARITDFYLESGKLDHALSEYNSISSFLPDFDDVSEYVLIVGINTYMTTKLYDRAERLAIKLLKHNSQHNKDIAYGTLMDLAQIHGDTKAVYKYGLLYKLCMDSLNEISQKETANLRNSLFRLSAKEEYHLTQSHKQQKNSYIVIFIACALCIASFIIIFWIYSHNRKLRKLSSQQLEKIDQLIAKTSINISKSNDSVETQNDRQSPQQQLQARFTEITTKVNPKEIRLSTIITSSDVYQKFKLFTDNKISKIDDNDWIELDNIVNLAHTGFKEKLYSLYNNLNEHEYNVCLLIKCKFSPTEIALLTYRSKTSVASTRSRLCNKFFCCNGTASDWDKFIHSL